MNCFEGLQYILEQEIVLKVLPTPVDQNANALVVPFRHHVVDLFHFHGIGWLSVDLQEYVPDHQARQMGRRAKSQVRDLKTGFIGQTQAVYEFRDRLISIRIGVQGGLVSLTSITPP